MTLARQLIIILVTLFLLVFAGTLVISVNNSRTYLAEQLGSHAQDTATSLGLSLVPALAQNDLALVETMVNAIFDPGYYREIVVEDAAGVPLVERRLPVKVEDVPQWFVNLIPLDTPEAQSEMSSGWRIAGKVRVTSHPGYAYRQLWLVAEQTFWWFLAVLAGAIILLVIALRFVLRPLRAVENQALAIAEREFPVVDQLPRTRELRRVVEAMNRMSQKVGRMLSDQTELTEKMRDQANVDPVTGLANRRNFDARLGHLVESSDEFQRGALFLCQLDGFKEYNDLQGYAAGDELLRETGRIVQEVFGAPERHVIARLGGGNFAVLARDITTEEAGELGDKLGGRLNQLHSRGLIDTPSAGHIGVAYYDGERTASELLSQADMALRAACGKGPNACHIYDAQALRRTDIRGAGEWRQVIQAVIDHRQIRFQYQPCLTCGDGSVLHHEALARIVGENGELLPAGVFIPMAERHGLIQAFDRAAVETLLGELGGDGAGGRYAINLSAASVHDAGFADWLAARLADSAGAARQLIFEVSEYAAMSDPEAMRRFAGRLRQVGAEFSLDHFGAGFASFGYLRDLKLDYLKIDGSYTRGIDTNKDNQFFVRAVADIAHGLDIRVVAESVETAEEWSALAELHVDAGQGYFLGRPADFGG